MNTILIVAIVIIVVTLLGASIMGIAMYIMHGRNLMGDVEAIGAEHIELGPEWE